MKLYLVTADLRVSQYMGETIETADIRLVRAENEEEAYDKFMAYWERKSDTYHTVYRPWNVSIHETIE